MYRTLLLGLVLILNVVNGIQLLPSTSNLVTAQVSSFYEPSQSPEQLIAGTGTWNSGRPPAGWILFNLGAPYFLSTLTLTCDQTTTHYVTHTVYGGVEEESQSVVLARFNLRTSDKQLLTAELNGIKVQYVKIVTTMSQDWVAWKNISLFGEPADEQVQLIPTDSLAVSARASGSADLKSTPEALITGTRSWNSGRYGENWIQINLGASFLLSSISLTCDQTIDDSTIHTVYGSVFAGEPFVLAHFDGVTSNYQVLSANFSDVEAQYINIVTTKSLDWVAWRKMTLFGALKRERCSYDIPSPVVPA